MKSKQRLELILSEQVPDVPLHWEMVFQIENDMWGMDSQGLEGADCLDFQVDVFRRLAAESDWAAVNGGYHIDSIRHIPKALNREVLITSFEGKVV